MEDLPDVGDLTDQELVGEDKIDQLPNALSMVDQLPKVEDLWGFFRPS